MQFVVGLHPHRIFLIVYLYHSLKGIPLRMLFSFALFSCPKVGAGGNCGS